MKNKFFILIVLFFSFFVNNLIFAEELNIESTEIQILENGNILKASKDIKIKSQDGIEITGNKLIYKKEEQYLDISGNVNYLDRNKNINIKSEKIIYNKKKGLLIVRDEVSYFDLKNNINIFAEELNYDENKEIINSKGVATGNIKNKYKIQSSNIFYERNSKKIYSKKLSQIEDKNKNKFTTQGFNFDLNKEILNAKELSLIDKDTSEYFTKNALVNFKTNEIVGKDLYVNLFNSIFGNKKNEPRLKGNSFFSNEEETTLQKGVFTSCAKIKDKCPPWQIKAEEIKHNKKKKIIEYKKAWLEIYDKPVLYFPKFVHPDPTVKRQTGFLYPRYNQSNKLGQSVQIPYFKVISDNKDFTVTPRLFFGNNILIQNEYRQANKNSNFISDFSINKDGDNYQTHLFSNYEGKFDAITTYKFKIESVSNDNYLDKYNIKSPLIDDTTVLNSYFKFNYNPENYAFNYDIQVIEDLSKSKSDRYEYIYPNFGFSKNLNPESLKNGNLNLNSNGYQRKYNTNVYELVNVNNLDYLSNSMIFGNGLSSNLNILLKNVNTNSDKSSIYKENTNNQLLSIAKFHTSYPLYKENDDTYSYLTPTLSLKYSPNKTKNIKDENKRINFNNIFSMNRIGRNDTVETGQSITYGLDYSKTSKSNNSSMDFGIANVLRDRQEDDLPTKTSLGNKRSDFVGKLGYNIDDKFKISYNFSLDNDLKHSNYDEISTELSVNNFITSFDFIEEDNFIGSKSSIQNRTEIKVNKSSSLIFDARKNLDQNITEYYNIIYEYENDCLTAALEYNKEFYDDDAMSGENLFFSIKFIPISGTNKKTKRINKD